MSILDQHQTKYNMKASAVECTMVSVTSQDDDSDSTSDENAGLLTDPLLEQRPLLSRGISAVAVMGTVRLTDGDLVYVPPATADPRDPLNMNPWQKTVVVIVVCSFSAISMSLIGGFGGIIGFYIPKYMDEGESYPNITHLMTYPVLFMGVGNLIGMPIAIAVGRRLVILSATIVLIVGAILCAASTSLSMHLAARMFIGLAAGQSESVVPLIIQEIHFLHERTRVLMIQQTIQVIISAIWMLCASPIAKAFSPSWWYGLGAGIAAFQFLISIFILPETKYPRDHTNVIEIDEDARRSSTIRPPLDFINYEARTWQSDMRLWIGQPEWKKAKEVLEQVLQLFFFPNIVWIVCLCGLTLGINISMATTYNSILIKPPYNWQDQNISYANFGQIPIALICFPLLGHASDMIIQWRARRNHGIHEPESRLLLLSLPVALGIISSFFYGQGATHPYNYHWILYPLTLAGYFFAFVGTNIICTTYLLDSYPNRAGPVLIFVCTCRGILSCLVSFNVARFVDRAGYDGTFSAFGLATTLLGSLVIPMFFFGKRIRSFTSRWTTDRKS